MSCPTLDQGAQVLVVGKHGDKAASELRHIPIEPAAANLNVSDYVLTLSPDGALAVHGTEKFRGDHNAEQRRDLADPATRQQLLEKHLAQVMPGAQVTTLAVERPRPLHRRDQLHLLRVAARARGGRRAGTLSMAISLYPHDLSGVYAELSARTTDVFVDHPWRTRNVMRYVLPRGWRVEDLPAGGEVKSQHLAFTQTITRTPDGFIVDEDAGSSRAASR